MRTAFLGLVLTAMALEISPALAQNVEQVKPVFEHILPNTEGKSMIAVVVTYPPGAKSPAHHHGSKTRQILGRVEKIVTCNPENTAPYRHFP
jgi:uncharacterized RmlC-like cupin family protein